MEPIFFKNSEELRSWFEQNHTSETAFWFGYYKKATKLPSVTWSESVDQAICFGWIDGIRKSIDEKSYKIRFTPRKSNSIWSAVNIEKVEKLTKAGLMLPEGIAAYEKKKASKSKIYAYERKNIVIDPVYLETIKANEKAFEFFEKLARDKFHDN